MHRVHTIASVAALAEKSFQCAQAFVMVLSAYETTANALAFTMYLLSKPENSAKLAKLTAEIDVFGRERVPTFEELDKFPWLEVPPTARLLCALGLYAHCTAHL